MPHIFIFQDLNNTQYVYIDSFSLIKKNNNKIPKKTKPCYIMSWA